MKYTNIIFLIILLSAGSFCLAGESEKKSKNEYFYILNYTFTRADAEIEINGVPAARSKKEFNYSSNGFSDIGQWVFPGENRVTVILRALLQKKETDFSHPKIELNLSTALQGQMSNEGKKFLEFRLPDSAEPKDEDYKNIKFPFRKEFTFVPEFAPPSELWAKAKPVDLDAASKKLIVNLIADYHGALKKKDVDKLYGLLLFKVREMSRIRYFAAEEAAASFKNDMKRLVNMKGFDLEALDRNTLVFRPIAGGKIIWVTDTAQGAPIKTKKMKDAGSMSFPIYAAFIDGKWALVR